MSTKRLYKMTYVYRYRYETGGRVSNETCLSAKTFLEAVRRAQSVAKESAKTSDHLFLRIKSLDDCGVIR